MSSNSTMLPDLTPLHTAVGKGISMFSGVEFGVGLCFASMLEPTPRKISVAAINSARSFEAKMKMVDATAEARLSGAELRKWRNLSCKITKRKNLRDKLAHWMVMYYPGATTAEELKKTKPALVPPFWSSAYERLYWSEEHNLDVRPISLKELETFHERTSELMQALLQFSATLGRKDKPEESSEDHPE